MDALHSSLSLSWIILVYISYSILVHCWTFSSVSNRVRFHSLIFRCQYFSLGNSWKVRIHDLLRVARRARVVIAKNECFRSPVRYGTESEIVVNQFRLVINRLRPVINWFVPVIKRFMFLLQMCTRPYLYYWKLNQKMDRIQIRNSDQIPKMTPDWKPNRNWLSVLFFNRPCWIQHFTFRD